MCVGGEKRILLSAFRFLPNEAARGAPPPPWFETFLERILEHNLSVLSLLGSLPEPFRMQPPRHVRVWLYDYRFTHQRDQDSTEVREKTPPDQIGTTWYRNRVQLYCKKIRRDV